MCNGLSSFAEAICSGTRAIKSQTLASGAEARRRRGRGRARSAQRDGAGARLHAAVRPADPGGAAQEGGARTICSATRVRSRKPSTRLPRGLPAALSHPSPPTSASIAAPAAMDARGRRRHGGTRRAGGGMFFFYLEKNPYFRARFSLKYEPPAAAFLTSIFVYKHFFVIVFLYLAPQAKFLQS